METATENSTGAADTTTFVDAKPVSVQDGWILESRRSDHNDGGYDQNGVIGLMSGLVWFEINNCAARVDTKLGLVQNGIWHKCTFETALEDLELVAEARRFAGDVAAAVAPPAPGAGRIEIDITYMCHSAQQAVDCGINGVAVVMLAESLGDKDKLVDGGVAFMYPFDHKKRPVWVFVTGKPPIMVAAPEPTPETTAETPDNDTSDKAAKETE